MLFVMGQILFEVVNPITSASKPEGMGVGLCASIIWLSVSSDPTPVVPYCSYALRETNFVNIYNLTF